VTGCNSIKFNCLILAASISLYPPISPSSSSSLPLYRFSFFLIYLSIFPFLFLSFPFHFPRLCLARIFSLLSIFQSHLLILSFSLSFCLSPAFLSFLAFAPVFSLFSFFLYSRHLNQTNFFFRSQPICLCFSLLSQLCLLPCFLYLSTSKSLLPFCWPYFYAFLSFLALLSLLAFLTK
jgi:hypothetical protein